MIGGLEGGTLASQINLFDQKLIALKQSHSEEGKTLQLLHKVLLQTAEHVQNTQLNSEQLDLLKEKITVLDKLVFKTSQIDKVEAVIKEVLDAMEENLQVISDPIMDDVIFISEPEFGFDSDETPTEFVYKNGIGYFRPKGKIQLRELKIDTPLFPSWGKNSEEYSRKFKAYQGCVEILDHTKLRSLQNDLYINQPSNTLIASMKEFVPELVLTDIHRLTTLKINDTLVVPPRKTNSQVLLCECLKKMKLDIKTGLEVLKITTQATLSRVCIRLVYGFHSEQPPLYVSAALKTGIEILTEENDIAIRYWSFYGFRDSLENDPFKYVGVMRKISFSRQFMVDINSKDARIEDVYSPLFSSLEDAMHCDFDQVNLELQVKNLIIRETKKSKNNFSMEKAEAGGCSIM